MSDRPARVLVIDDELDIQESLVAFLDDLGYQVYTAENAMQALVFLFEEKVDVAIVDIRMPGMDGNALIVRAHENWPDLKFIVHTGSRDYQLTKALTEIGVLTEHVFHKPLKDLNHLHEAIIRLMENE